MAHSRAGTVKQRGRARDDTGIGVLAGEARKTTTMIKMMMTQSAVCVEELPHNQSVI